MSFFDASFAHKLDISPATAPANDHVFMQLAKKYMYETINKGISSAVARSSRIMVLH